MTRAKQEKRDGIFRYETKSGTRYRVILRHGGKLYTKGGFTKQGAAKAWRDRTRHELREQTYAEPTKQTFGEYAEDWLNTAPMREVTRTNYRYLLSADLSFWHDTPIKNIRPEHVRQWLHRTRTRKANTPSGRLQESTVQQQYRLLKAILNRAQRERLIRQNPCIERMTETPERDVPDITAKQILRLADQVPEEYRALILLSGFGALRWSEAIALQRGDIDLEHGTVTITRAAVQQIDGVINVGPPKSRAGTRTVYVPSIVTEALKTHCEGMSKSERLFTNTTGGYLHRSNFRRLVWLPAIKATRLPTTLTFHGLRHTALTLLAQQGATTKELMAQAGHANPRTALRYQHAQEQRMRDLADRLGATIPTKPKLRVVS